MNNFIYAWGNKVIVRVNNNNNNNNNNDNNNNNKQHSSVMHFIINSKNFVQKQPPEVFYKKSWCS